MGMVAMGMGMVAMGTDITAVIGVTDGDIAITGGAIRFGGALVLGSSLDITVTGNGAAPSDLGVAHKGAIRRRCRLAPEACSSLRRTCAKLAERQL